MDEDNSNSKIVFTDNELSEKNYFKFEELVNMEQEMTEATWFCIQRLKCMLEEYKKSNNLVNFEDEDVFAVLLNTN